MRTFGDEDVRAFRGGRWKCPAPLLAPLVLLGEAVREAAVGRFL